MFSERLARLEFEDIDQYTVNQTFKLYQDTTFDDIKLAACTYWGYQKQADDYVLTDEYFNVLSTYKDTVQNFFEDAAGYKPLNSDVLACAFLIKKNPEKKFVHMLQLESIEMQDDNNKKEEGGEGEQRVEAQNENQIDIKKISEIIVGLKTYEANIDDKKLVEYINFSCSHKEPTVNIWAFICGVALLAINIVGKQIKNDYIEEYQFRKIVESFFRMEANIDTFVV